MITHFFFNFVDVNLSSAFWRLPLAVPETKLAEYANSVDLDEGAHNKPPHIQLHYLPSSL